MKCFCKWRRGHWQAWYLHSRNPHEHWPKVQITEDMTESTRRMMHHTVTKADVCVLTVQPWSQGDFEEI